MAFGIEEIIERDGACVVYIQSEEELLTLREVWSKLDGIEFSIDVLKRYAAKSDLCLELSYNTWRRQYDWTWGERAVFFNAIPTIRIYKVNELIPSCDDLGEIETNDIVNIFAIFRGELNA